MRSIPFLLAALLLLPAGEAQAHRAHGTKSKQKKAAADRNAKRDQPPATHETERTHEAADETPVKVPVQPRPRSTPAAKGAIAAVDPGGHRPDAKLRALEVVGRLHPMVVHLPIGWLVLLVLVELLVLVRKGDFWTRASAVLLGLTALSLIPGIATGLIRHSTHGGEDNGALILSHRNAIFGMAAAVAVALALRLWKKERLVGSLKLVYLALILAAAALMTVGAHLGGKAVFGPDYLPF